MSKCWIYHTIISTSTYILLIMLQMARENVITKSVPDSRKGGGGETDCFLCFNRLKSMCACLNRVREHMYRLPRHWSYLQGNFLFFVSHVLPLHSGAIFFEELTCVIMYALQFFRNCLNYKLHTFKTQLCSKK